MLLIHIFLFLRVKMKSLSLCRLKTYFQSPAVVLLQQDVSKQVLFLQVMNLN